jgi:rubrerythrin
LSVIEDQLKQVIGADSVDEIKYQRYAEIASKEGLNNLKLLFQGMSKGKKIAVINLKQALGDLEFESPKLESPLGIESSIENVQNAIAHSTEALNEYKKAHLKYLSQIQENELGALAVLAVKWTTKLERTHLLVLKHIVKYVKESKDNPETAVFVCRVCGNLILGEPERLCPICDHDPIYYEPVSEIATEGEN